jgi:hypothetical protein
MRIRALVSTGSGFRAGRAGSTGRRDFFLLAGAVGCWSGRYGQGVQPVQGGDDLSGPGPSGRDAQPDAAAAADQASGHGEQPQPQPQPFGLVAAGGAVQGEQLHPGDQFAGQGDDLQPDLVLGEVVQWQVAQAGVLGGPDPVLAAGSAAVPQFQVGQLAAACAGDESGEAVPVQVGEAQLHAGVRAFLSDDDPHPGRVAGQVEQAGEFGDPGAGPGVAIGLVGRAPRIGGQGQDRGGDVVGDVSPTE